MALTQGDMSIRRNDQPWCCVSPETGHQSRLWTGEKQGVSGNSFQSKRFLCIGYIRGEKGHEMQNKEVVSTLCIHSFFFLKCRRHGAPGWLSRLSVRLFFKFFYCLLFLRERDREQAGKGQRERETQNRKQAPGSECSGQSPTWGLNSQTSRS